jgi:hypothetical protein
VASYSLSGFDGKVEKNVHFGVARALTQTAKAASETVASKLPTIFDRPTPFTQKGIGFTSAKRDSLTATVFVKDVQAGYLMMQETGGVRAPRPGSPINLAVKQRLNAYGNIARGAIARLKAKDDVFAASGNNARTRHLKPGIYERSMQGKRRKGGSGSKGEVYNKSGKAVGGKAAKGGATLKMLIAFKRKATYQPRFQFEARTVKAANAVLANNIERSVAEALGSMR